jgi:hypothetical protein
MSGRTRRSCIALTQAAAMLNDGVTPCRSRLSWQRHIAIWGDAQYERHAPARRVVATRYGCMHVKPRWHVEC